MSDSPLPTPRLVLLKCCVQQHTPRRCWFEHAEIHLDAEAFFLKPNNRVLWVCFPLSPAAKRPAPARAEQQQRRRFFAFQPRNGATAVLKRRNTPPKKRCGARSRDPGLVLRPWTASTKQPAERKENEPSRGSELAPGSVHAE